MQCLNFIDVPGFSLREVSTPQREKLWGRGGFPRAFLAETDSDSRAWREGSFCKC